MGDTVVPKQWLRLIDIVQLDYEMRTNQCIDGPNGLVRLNSKWQRAAEEVNTLSPAKKNGLEWKVYRQRIKQTAQEKNVHRSPDCRTQEYRSQGNHPQDYRPRPQDCRSQSVPKTYGQCYDPNPQWQLFPIVQRSLMHPPLWPHSPALQPLPGWLPSPGKPRQNVSATISSSATTYPRPAEFRSSLAGKGPARKRLHLDNPQPFSPSKKSRALNNVVQTPPERAEKPSFSAAVESPAAEIPRQAGGTVLQGTEDILRQISSLLTAGVSAIEKLREAIGNNTAAVSGLQETILQQMPESAQ